MRATADGKSSVATIAAAEALRPPPPTPFPATLIVERVVSAQALVPFRGNRYSVPPELAHGRVTLALRLGAVTVEVATVPGPGGAGGVVIARHRLAPDGPG